MLFVFLVQIWIILGLFARDLFQYRLIEIGDSQLDKAEIAATNIMVVFGPVYLMVILLVTFSR